MDTKGEITNKEGYLLKYEKYEKVGNDYKFNVYKPNEIPTQDMKMTFNQFINYLYSELYVDNRTHSSIG